MDSIHGILHGLAVASLPVNLLYTLIGVFIGLSRGLYGPLASEGALILAIVIPGLFVYLLIVNRELVAPVVDTALGRFVLLPVPIQAAVLAAKLTRIVTPEQINRLAEDKAFPIVDAAHDFNFAPHSFAEGVQLEAESLGLAGRTQRR